KQDDNGSSLRLLRQRGRRVNPRHSEHSLSFCIGHVLVDTPHASSNHLRLSCILLVKRKVASSGVTLDVQAVKKQADQVKSDDFFKSLQSQLEQKTTKWKNKKETQTKDENG